MEMGGHNDIGIDPQTFLINTKIETVSDGFASRLVEEYRQPFDDGEGDVIQPHVGNNAIAFYASIMCSRMETFGRFFSAGSETHAEQVCPWMETFGLQLGQVTDRCRASKQTVKSLRLVPGYTAH